MMGVTMSEDDDEAVEVRLRRSLTTFLEMGTFYREYKLEETDPSVGGNHYRHPPEDLDFPTDLRIQLPCRSPSCGGTARTFAFDQPDGERDRRLLSLSQGESHLLMFHCTHCTEHKVAFLVHIALTGENCYLSVFKAGQWPSDRKSPEPALAKALGDDAEPFYRKGLDVERFGYGVAAFAYYRRVTETIIGRLMDSLRQFAVDTGSTELVAMIDAKAAEQQASKRIEAVKELVPPALRPGGLNPLGTLYAALSSNLHEGSDEECLQHAHQLRIALEFLLRTFADRVASRDEFVRAVHRLEKANSKKKASGQ